jgi:hypothetical protein
MEQSNKHKRERRRKIDLKELYEQHHMLFNEASIHKEFIEKEKLKYSEIE